jgi:hypothetical protein
MQCFAHPNEPAVGVCKSCGKGVCRSCAVSLDRGLACSEQCKPYVEALSRLQVATIRNVGLVSAQRFIQPLVAVVFLAAAIYFFISSGPNFFAWFMLALGLVFAFSASFTWVRRSRAHQ